MAIDGSNPYLAEYDAYATTAKTAYQKALAKVAQQRTTYHQGYGLGPDGQPVANNPYGQYQQMMGGLAQQSEASDAAGAARGLGGGITSQAAAAADRISKQTTYDFGRNYEAGLSNFSEAEEGAGFDYNNSLMTKMAEITQRAIQDRLYNPGAASTPDPYGDATPLPGAIPGPAGGGGFIPPPPIVKKPKKKRRRR